MPDLERRVGLHSITVNHGNGQADGGALAGLAAVSELGTAGREVRYAVRSGRPFRTRVGVGQRVPNGILVRERMSGVPRGSERLVVELIASASAIRAKKIRCTEE
jgi:hypothetical protein